MLFFKPYVKIGSKPIYFHRTQSELEDLERAKQERKLRAAIRKEQKKEVRYLAKQIPAWLANLGHAYWYRKSEKDLMKGRFNPVRFTEIQIGEDAYYLKINAKRLPRGVNMYDLKDEKTVFSLSKSCGSQVKFFDVASGCWYAIETAYGRGGIPTFVGYAEMLKMLPADAPPMIFPLGMGENQKPLFCNLDRVYTLLIGGAKGTGKSNEANVILCTLITRNSPKRLRLFLTDLKGGIEFYDYGGIPHLGGDVFVVDRDRAEEEPPPENGKKKKQQKITLRVVPQNHKPKEGEVLKPPLGQEVITDPADVLPMLAYCEAELDRRARLIAPTGAKNILSYNKKYPDKMLSYWLIVIDELATLMESPAYKKQATLSLNELARKGRAVGLYMILATQTPSSDIVPGQVANNMDARLAFRTGSGSASGLLLGDGQYDAVHLPAIEGRLIWKWGVERVQVQAPYLAESAMRTIVNDVRAGKYVDAKEAELAQKADYLFRFALQNLGGECHTHNLYGFLKQDGFKRAEITRILEQHELRENGPEILIEDETYYLVPPYKAKRIARWLVPVADVKAGRHSNPDYDYQNVEYRKPKTEIPPSTIYPETANPTDQIAPALTAQIDDSTRLAADTITVDDAEATPELAIADLTVRIDEAEATPELAIVANPATPDDAPAAAIATNGDTSGFTLRVTMPDWVEELQQPQSEPTLLKSLVYRPTFNKVRTVRFLSVRKWRTASKDKDLQILKFAKERCQPDLITSISGEISSVILEFIGSVNGYLTCAPPGHSAYKGLPHFATEIAKQVAANLDIEFIPIFEPRPRKDSSSPRHFDKRGDLVLLTDPPQKAAIFIDDVATSGTTVEECVNCLKAFGSVTGVVWLYGQGKQ